MPKYHIADDLLLQTVREEAVILNPTSGKYFTLNEVGTRMVQLYRELVDEDQVIAKITAEYAIDAATARADLQQLLHDMTANGLAEPVSAATD